MLNHINSRPTVRNCTFCDNRANEFGGGMINWVNCSSTVTHCTFSGNEAQYGGGMDNIGSSPMVINCTFSGNEAHASGGGMWNWIGSNPTVTNCTFSDNEAHASGGGMWNYTSGPTLKNTILAGNTPDNCSGKRPTSGGHNLENGTSCKCDGLTDQQNTDPLLGELQDNGGPTETHSLLAGSPAIDAGSCDVATDQRGVARPQPAAGECDIGAVEMRWFTLEVTTMGSGAVTSSPGGIDCGDTCAAAYPEGTHVTLTASPAADYLFAGWSGDASGAGPSITVTMDGGRAVTASFTLRPYATGDINGDSAIDLLDVVLCQQIVCGLVHGTAAQRAAADVDDDGDVDADDVTILSEYVVGIRTTLP